MKSTLPGAVIYFEINSEGTIWKFASQSNIITKQITLQFYHFTLNESLGVSLFKVGCGLGNKLHCVTLKF